MIGVYKDKRLTEVIQSDEQTSDALPKLIKQLQEKYDCAGLYYVKGPGSFMAIKIGYIFLKSLSIALDVPLLACTGFAINQNKPIPASGKMYFVKKGEDIKLEKLELDETNKIAMPKDLKTIDFSIEIEPLYILPAI